MTLIYDGQIDGIPVKISLTNDGVIEVSTQVQKDFDKIIHGMSIYWKKGDKMDFSATNKDNLIKQLEEVGFDLSQAKEIANRAFPPL